MKKSVLMLLILSVLFSFAGCGESAEQTSSSAPNTLALTDDSSVTETSTEQTSSISTVVVPDVVGMDKDEAVKKLEDLGLKVELVKVRWQYENDTAVAHNVVIEQDSAEGTVMIPGSTVKVTYNLQENEYAYEENEDGTITITMILVKERDPSEYRIPKQYDNKTISRLSGDACIQLSIIAGTMGGGTQKTKIIVPQGVFDYTPDFRYETY